jgi:hypothetical protein
MESFFAHLKTPLAMKKLLPIVLAAFTVGCGTSKEVQMDLTDVKLVKIDTIQRYPNNTEKILTWQDDNHLNYVTFVPMEVYYALGARMKVMMKR